MPTALSIIRRDRLLLGVSGHCTAITVVRNAGGFRGLGELLRAFEAEIDPRPREPNAAARHAPIDAADVAVTQLERAARVWDGIEVTLESISRYLVDHDAIAPPVLLAKVRNIPV